MPVVLSKEEVQDIAKHFVRAIKYNYNKDPSKICRVSLIIREENGLPITQTYNFKPGEIQKALEE